MTSDTSTEPRYGLMAIVLHWVLAVFIRPSLPWACTWPTCRFPWPSSN